MGALTAVEDQSWKVNRGVGILTIRTAGRRLELSRASAAVSVPISAKLAVPLVPTTTWSNTRASTSAKASTIRRVMAVGRTWHNHP